MGSINVNRNVYDAVKAVTEDGYLSSPKVSGSEIKDVEAAIAADGQIDTGEEQLMTALKNKTSFTVNTQGQAPYDVGASLLNFPSSTVSTPQDGRTSVHSDGRLHRVPDAVPAQKSGRKTDVFDSKVGGDFNAAKTRLLDVNNWGNTADSMAGANFQLTDGTGKNVSGRDPKVGDFIKIDLPGPSGDDWVQVESISNKPDELSITVRPSRDPSSSSNETQHFFSNSATNTFTVNQGKTESGESIVEFHVNGRNEKTNLTEGFWNLDVDNAINRAKNAGGSVTGAQTAQWENLGAGILQ